MSEPCCTPGQAWAWCRELAVMALASDPDAQRLLPDAIGHFLAAIRREVVYE